METDTGTEHGTMGSLEMAHEEAEEISRSMDLSLAFWGEVREQPDMISATKLKCALQQPSRASETAQLLWDKMDQGELEKVKQVERILMKDGEISMKMLFGSLKGITEGVGLTLENLSNTDAENVVSLLTNIMSEILYIYNQNVPPEITDAEEYTPFVEGEICDSTSEEQPVYLESDEDDNEEINIRIGFLLEKARELGLGEIRVPSTSMISGRSKLSIVERQVNAKLRLRNIRRIIKTRRNEKGDMPVDNNIGKEEHRTLISRKDRNKKSIVGNSIIKRPVFKTAVKSQSVDYNSTCKKVPNLQQRLRRANRLRKKLVEENTKEQFLPPMDQEMRERKKNNSKIISKEKKKVHVMPTNYRRNEEIIHSYNVTHNEPRGVNQISQQSWRNFKTNNTLLVNESREKYNEIIDEELKAEGGMERKLEGEKCLINGLQESTNITNSRVHSDKSSNLIMSIGRGKSEEYIEQNKAFISQNHQETTVSQEVEEVTELKRTEKHEEPKSGEKTEDTDAAFDASRPCSRGEMLTEMKKLLKEALTEVVIPKAVYKPSSSNSLEFTGNGEGPLVQDRKETILENISQTNKSVPSCKTGCTCCDQTKEESKADVERIFKSDEEMVDIKVTQEGSLPNTWSVSGDQEQKLLTEISFKQNGPGPAVKLSVVTRVKSQENEQALTHRKFDEQDQGNVKEALNILKDFIEENVREKEEAADTPEVCDRPGSSSESNQSMPNTQHHASSSQIEINHSPQPNNIPTDELPALNVNLAMLLQQCSYFQPEILRTCGPFQIGGMLLTDQLPGSLDRNIGDGNDITFSVPWRDSWSSDVWRENFTSLPRTDSDSLYDNRSEDVLESSENIEPHCSQQPLLISDPETDVTDDTVLKKMYSTAGSILNGILAYIMFPVKYSLCALKSSVNKIYSRSAPDDDSNKNPETCCEPPT